MAKIKADLHNHLSTLENFGNIFDKAMLTAQRNLGIAGIFAIVNAQDKTNIGRYETFLKQGGSNVRDFENAFGVPEYGVYVIKGQEVFTQDEHVLVLGLKYGEKIEDYRPLKETLEEVKDKNLITIADHPWFFDGIFAMKSIQDESIPLLDAIEVHNGEAWLPVPNYPGYIDPNFKSKNLYKDRLNENFNIGAISTSDGHSVREIGSSYSVLEQPDFYSGPEALVETLRNSIRNHKDWSNDKQTNSVIGTLNHASKVIGLRLAAKAGLIKRVN